MRKIFLWGAAVSFGIGLPFFFGWLRGDFVVFWTQQGAALFQAFGMAAAFLWGAWLDKPRKRR